MLCLINLLLANGDKLACTTRAVQIYERRQTVCLCVCVDMQFCMRKYLCEYVRAYVYVSERKVVC